MKLTDNQRIVVEEYIVYYAYQQSDVIGIVNFIGLSESEQSDELKEFAEIKSSESDILLTNLDLQKITVRDKKDVYDEVANG